MYRSLVVTIFLFFIVSLTWAQETKLAQQYFRDGEYEKSAQLYKKLYEEKNYNDYYFKYYFNSLLNLGAYEEAEEAIKKAIKKRPQETHLLVRQGALLERRFENEKAEKLYDKAIKALTNNRMQIVRTANVFNELTKYEYALKVYERGVELSDDVQLYASNLAELYRRTGNEKKMIEYYLLYAGSNANSLKYVKQVLQRQYSDSLGIYLKEVLFQRIQEKPDELFYVDLLSWVYVQGKEYNKALRQMIALDRRMNEEGFRVFDLAEIAEKDKDYATAIKAYQYIVDNKSENNPYFMQAKRKQLSCRIEQLNSEGSLPKEELLKIRDAFDAALTTLGTNNRTAEISLEKAIFEAYYMNRTDLAIDILEELISRRGLDENVKARAKLELGDYYLISGEIWDGSLLFSQVDKTFQEGYFGELARFKNAKLSYYTGDFEWAKIQLDVLKRSTSKLISNDAIDLSVFISENIGLDSTQIPLQMYARAELDALQHKYESAFSALDSIAFLYPDHELEDDIWYLKANIYKGQHDYSNAELYYKKVIDKHIDDIRGDNALFQLAELYDNQLKQPAKAKELYERIFMDFSNSTFAIEARERYRALSDSEKFILGYE
jgi:tetratricopeptide (TPR) repeat protein